MKKKLLACLLLLCPLFAFFSCNDDDSKSGKGTSYTDKDEMSAGQQDDSKSSYTVPVAEDVVMYEANPRVFAEKNSLKAIETRLDDIKSLGVNVVWIMPIYTHGEEKYKGSPYCIKNYKEIDPEYGTLGDLKSLVETAHGKGMAVLMDWVANHTSWDNVWIETHKDWYTQDEAGNILPPIAAWSDVADLNFDNAEMRQAMIDAMKYWITEVGVDGFRCDAADYVPIDFWKDAVAQLRACREKNILMLAEGNKADYFGAGFNMNFGWTYYSNLDKIYKGEKTLESFSKLIRTQLGKLSEDRQTLHFTTNHDKSADEKTDVQLFNGNRGAMSAFVITATMAGTPLIYSSQETGHESNFSFFRYYNLNWDENPDITAEYQKIMSIYTSSDIFRNRYMKIYEDAGNADVLYYTHDNGEMQTLVVVNVRNAESTFAVPETFQNVPYKDLMNGGDKTFGATESLPAYQYYILEKK